MVRGVLTDNQTVPTLELDREYLTVVLTRSRAWSLFILGQEEGWGLQMGLWVNTTRWRYLCSSSGARGLGWQAPLVISLGTPHSSTKGTRISVLKLAKIGVTIREIRRSVKLFKNVLLMSENSRKSKKKKGSFLDVH